MTRTGALLLIALAVGAVWRVGPAPPFPPPAFAQAPAPLDWVKLSDEAVENLRAYLRFDTQNPPANVSAAAAFLRCLLEKEGFQVRVYEPAPGKVNLLARLKGTGVRKPVLLLNHLDVVPVDASRWKVPPFGGVVQEGKIWGRGAMDMKGLGMIELMALVALKRAGSSGSGPALERDIIFLATADEETGGQWGALWMINNHYAELDPEYVLDEGGFGTRDILAPGRLVYGISVADKRPFWVRVIAQGTSGHGSQPIADNANVILMNALARVLDRPQPAAEIPLVRLMRQKMGGTFAQNKFTNAIQRNTISLTALRAGVGDPPKANVIPSHSEAILDCRLLPGESPEEFLRKLKEAAAEPRVKMEVIYVSAPNLVSSSETPFYATIERVLGRHSAGAGAGAGPGATVVAPIMVPYGTDGNSFRNRGATVYGFSPMVVDLAALSSMHSDQEHIPLDEFKKAVRILFDILSEFSSAQAAR